MRHKIISNICCSAVKTVRGISLQYSSTLPEAPSATYACLTCFFYMLPALVDNRRGINSFIFYLLVTLFC